jgi:hypothetical protein
MKIKVAAIMKIKVKQYDKNHLQNKQTYDKKCSKAWKQRITFSSKRVLKGKKIFS